MAPHRLSHGALQKMGTYQTGPAAAADKAEHIMFSSNSSGFVHACRQSREAGPHMPGDRQHNRRLGDMDSNTTSSRVSPKYQITRVLPTTHQRRPCLHPSLSQKAGLWLQVQTSLIHSSLYPASTRLRLLWHTLKCIPLQSRKLSPSHLLLLCACPDVLADPLQQRLQLHHLCIQRLQPAGL